MNQIKLIIIACCLFSCSREVYDFKIDMNSGLKSSKVVSVYLVEKATETRITVLSDSGQRRRIVSENKDLINLIAQNNFESKPQLQDVDKPSFIIHFKNEPGYKQVDPNSALHGELSSFFSSMEKSLLIAE